jgi:hypothetical protein
VRRGGGGGEPSRVPQTVLHALPLGEQIRLGGQGPECDLGQRGTDWVDTQRMLGYSERAPGVNGYCSAGFLDQLIAKVCTTVCPRLSALNCCLPSTAVCPQLFALNYCLPSTTVRPQLFALNYCLPSTDQSTAKTLASCLSACSSARHSRGCKHAAFSRSGRYCMLYGGDCGGLDPASVSDSNWNVYTVGAVAGYNDKENNHIKSSPVRIAQVRLG